jgi:hypothetical protein
MPGGLTMAQEVLDRKRAEFVALAETAFAWMFGSDEQNGLVTFAEREHRERLGPPPKEAPNGDPHSRGVLDQAIQPAGQRHREILV